MTPRIFIELINFSPMIWESVVHDILCAYYNGTWVLQRKGPSLWLPAGSSAPWATMLGSQQWMTENGLSIDLLMWLLGIF